MEWQVIDGRTEYMTNPLGLDERAPRFFWKLRSDERNAAQSAYRILVASTPEALDRDEGDMWDSGEVESDRTTHIVYEGKPLQSEGQYFWKVRSRNNGGIISAWSDTYFWTMGLLSRQEWKGSWIGRRAEPNAELQPSPYVRKEFEARSGIRRATAYATALGLYELHVNGRTVGERFAPGFTDYDKRVQTQAYDVTPWLTEGANAIGGILGDGWYSGTVGFLGNHVYGERPFFLLQLNIEYEDGTRESIATDASWRIAKGPIVYSDMIKGETYDARLELTGWDLPGYDDSGWEQPDVRAGYNGLLTAMMEPPVRVTQTLKPISIRRTEQGTFIYDMGQNMVGWTEIKVRGARGAKVTASHAEMLNPDGSLYLDNLRVAVQQDHYILKGDGEERYEPRFTFHGYRYVELIGYPGEPDLDTIVGKVVHSDTKPTGSLRTSDPMVNQLISNISWGQRGNFLSVPTDCPQRDERLGWTGDAQIFARTASYNMDVSRFFAKFMLDMIDCQQPSGAFTDVAPDAGWIRHKMWNTRLNWFAPDNAGWGDAGVVIPWTLYLMYGDTRILDTHYGAMVRWVEYLRTNSEGLIRPAYANYGDWLSIEADTPNEVLATAYFAYSAQLLSRIAGALGKREDEAAYSRLHEDIAAAFRREFVSEDGRIQGGTQTVYVLALQFGLLTDELRKLAVGHLAADIESRGGRLSTGFLGVGYLLPALTDNGRLDVAYGLLTQEEFPSWMYSIKHGATTIWERWDGWTEHGGFQTPSMNSFNHYSLGSVGEWMYRYLGGIEADPQAPGFRRAIVQPRPGGRITSADASYESLHGRYESSWTLEADGTFKLRVTVPANAAATVHVPGSRIVLDGRPAQEGTTSFELGSGSYEFESRFSSNWE
ncbi:glycoside hydrolase family 78 protein [Cohnella fermenti]|uniref:alpha-L-rhamnosidase n=1 Tax=Cohnella fermenti TaxID=2565925 RepID=A0A4S4BXE2_9BACL|nr:glycoside hydrolase family 78 protein [Cohnella fermenti]THF79853.1 alpha-L-rhamnosidase [Cohnella fermenti]